MKLSLSHWYPGSGVVLDYIDHLSLPSLFYFNRTVEDVRAKKLIESYE